MKGTICLLVLLVTLVACNAILARMGVRDMWLALAAVAWGAVSMALIIAVDE